MYYFALVALALLSLNQAWSQDATEEERTNRRCYNALLLIQPDLGAYRQETKYCFRLADDIATQILLLDSNPLGYQPTPRDYQPVTGQRVGAGGSLAQDEAVPSVQPLALAGAVIGAQGTEGGTSSIAGFTLNPMMFSTSMSGDDDEQRIARFSRFMDASVLLPVDGADANKDGALDYFGLRVRMNVHGLFKGGELVDEIKGMLRGIAQRQGELSEEILEILENAPDCEKCAEALYAGRMDELVCGPGRTSPQSEKLILALKKKIATLRNEMDASYYGLDLRYDAGDPSLGSTPGASGRGMFAAFAIGKTLSQTTDSKSGWRVRLGLRQFDQDDWTDSSALNPVDSSVVYEKKAGVAEFQVDGAAGLEFTKTMSSQVLALSVGAEFRMSGSAKEMSEALQTNYLLLRVALSIPISDSNTVSVSYAKPLLGAVSQVLTVNYGWNLLLPDSAE